MAYHAAAPIDIARPARFGSSSPGNNRSNLTVGLQADTTVRPSALGLNCAPDGSSSRPSFGRHESVNNGFGSSYYGNGARPISVKDRPRRESVAGSGVTQMSWGGVSVGSMIRDEFLMAGTSPYLHQSPSFHSSSYIPRMEANFMRDFVCCGLNLDSLHDLLQHYEEVHSIPNGPTMQNQAHPQSDQGAMAVVNGAPPLGAPASAAQQHMFQQQPAPQQAIPNRSTGPAQPFIAQQQLAQTMPMGNRAAYQDLGDLDDMEIDEPAPQQQHLPTQLQQRFNQSGHRMSPLNIGVANSMHVHQGLRTSTPTTPAASNQGFPFHSNPTVSSVNTPTLQTHPLQQQQFPPQHNKSSPDSSVPGTPGDHDFATFHGLPVPHVAADQYIDEPAKRLFSKHGGAGFGQTPFAVGPDQLLDPEAMYHLREKQANGAHKSAMPFQTEERKPYLCPVIGCEKAYKNQNGLKYHKLHGHQKQQLKENLDGTFSIVDPVTSVPYPGTVGMEKEKPYRCDSCGKRYKNHNGLKYHRGHAAACNPEPRPATLPGANPMQAMGVNVAGVGIVGMNVGMY